MTGRKILHMAVALEQIRNGKELQNFKIIVGVNYDEEVAIVKEFCSWNFFGFEQQNIIFITIPSFPGILDVPHGEKLTQVRVQVNPEVDKKYLELRTNARWN